MLTTRYIFATSLAVAISTNGCTAASTIETSADPTQWNSVDEPIGAIKSRLSMSDDILSRNRTTGELTKISLDPNGYYDWTDNQGDNKIRYACANPANCENKTGYAKVLPPLHVVGRGQFRFVCNVIGGDPGADIVIHDHSTGQIIVWLVSGTQIYDVLRVKDPVTNQPWSVLGDWDLYSIGDFDNRGPGTPDGLCVQDERDLVWRNKVTKQVGIWHTVSVEDPVTHVRSILSGQYYHSTINNSSYSTGWEIVGAANFSGANQSQILWQNVLTGEIGWWNIDSTYAGWFWYTDIYQSSTMIPGTIWPSGTQDKQLVSGTNLFGMVVSTSPLGYAYRRDINTNGTVADGYPLRTCTAGTCTNIPFPVSGVEIVNH